MAWGTLGAALMTHKFQQAAATCFKQAEKLQPNEPRWPYLHGVMLLTGDAEAAIPHLSRATELAGDHPPAPKLRLADALLERGQLDEAERHLQSLLQRHPDEPHVALGLGKLAFAREQFDEALKDLDRAARSPYTARASLALIAGIQQRLGNSMAAAAAVKQLAKMPRDLVMVDPFVGEASALQTGMQASLTRADRLFRAGRKGEGMALLEKTASLYSRSATPWRVLGQARFNEKDYAGAEKALRHALELSPNESTIHFQLGNALLAQNLPTQAAECFRRATDLWPSYAPAYYQLGECLARDGRNGEAIEAFRAAVRHDPAFALGYRQLGAALIFEHRRDEAIAALERAVKLDPADRHAVDLLQRARTAPQG